MDRESVKQSEATGAGILNAQDPALAQEEWTGPGVEGRHHDAGSHSPADHTWTEVRQEAQKPAAVDPWVVAAGDSLHLG